MEMKLKRWAKHKETWLRGRAVDTRYERQFWARREMPLPVHEHVPCGFRVDLTSKYVSTEKRRSNVLLMINEPVPRQETDQKGRVKLLVQ